jgi:hypothetical protein
MSANARWFGYVPQRESVDWDFPVSVRRGRPEWAATARRLGSKRPRRRDVEIAREVLSRVGLRPTLPTADLNSGFPADSSNGSFLARALRRMPSCISMDEPFAASGRPPLNRPSWKLLRELRSRGKNPSSIRASLPCKRCGDYFDLPHPAQHARGGAWTTWRKPSPEANLQKTYGGPSGAVGQRRRGRAVGPGAKPMRKNRHCCDPLDSGGGRRSLFHVARQGAMHALGRLAAVLGIRYNTLLVLLGVRLLGCAPRE